MSKRKAKKKTKKQMRRPILLGSTAHQRIVSMIVEMNKYLATAKDILNVPENWVVTHDQRNIPIGFAPPEKEK